MSRFWGWSRWASRRRAGRGLHRHRRWTICPAYRAEGNSAQSGHAGAASADQRDSAGAGRQDATSENQQDPGNGEAQRAASADQKDAASADQKDPTSAQPEDDPAWLRALDAQPEAAAEARRWRAAASDAAQLDAAYFSADATARGGLAARLYDTDPAAFRAMLADGARMLSQRDPQGLAELARQLGAQDNAATQAAPKSVAQAARPDFRRDAIPDPRQGASQDGRRYSQQGIERDANPSAQANLASKINPASQTNLAPQTNTGAQNNNLTENSPAAFPADAYREFQSAANDAVGRRVHDAIDNTLRATLPEGIADGARRRMGDDIFREVHTALAADRDLGRQIGDVLAGWRFDAAARQQVTSLVAGRARAVLPEVARRVVSEWTSSVLASDRAKSARIAAAASRHDITGGRLPEPVPTGALRPRDIDYGRLSDGQILSL